MANGCLEAIVTWNNIIVDGHNRYEICNRLGIPFAIEEKAFQDKAEVKLFMLEKQCGRRNLSTFARVELVLNLSPEIEAKAKKNQAEGCLNSDKVDSLGELAKLAGVSRDTVHRVKKIIDYVKDHPEYADLLPQLRRKEKSINEAYREIRDAEYPKLIIDPEIRSWSGRFDDPVERARYEAWQIMNRKPERIDVWGRTIVWGHTEYEVCKKHGITVYPVPAKGVNSKRDAILYRLHKWAEWSEDYEEQQAYTEDRLQQLREDNANDPEFLALLDREAAEQQALFEKILCSNQ